MWPYKLRNSSPWTNCYRPVELMRIVKIKFTVFSYKLPFIFLSLPDWTWYFLFSFYNFLKIAYHPGLRALWDENQASIHHVNKWILFLKAISSNNRIHNVDAWMNLPSDLVVSSAACYYLYVNSLYSSSCYVASFWHAFY